MPHLVIVIKRRRFVVFRKPESDIFHERKVITEISRFPAEIYNGYVTRLRNSFAKGFCAQRNTLACHVACPRFIVLYKLPVECYGVIERIILYGIEHKIRFFRRFRFVERLRKEIHPDFQSGFFCAIVIFVKIRVFAYCPVLTVPPITDAQHDEIYTVIFDGFPIDVALKHGHIDTGINRNGGVTVCHSAAFVT